ncbi:MAG: hypothetical protein KF709_03290 [Gemmatimonadaceae bacterium]|nr:hypothetical protein [Gemmatimonadaceae bacterium]
MLQALAAAFAEDVTMPDGPRGFADGRSAVLAALGRDTLAATSRLRWAPARAAVSGDGSHGFTMGFMEIQRADGSRVPLRYLAYWIRGAEGWQMRVFRRAPRGEGAVDTAYAGSLQGPATGGIVPAPALEERRAELAATERAFSDSSQTIGLGEAFALFGHPQAWHLNGPAGPDLVRGREAVVRSVSTGVPPGTSPFVWGADRTLVAPSGDFGVNLGVILRAEARGLPGFPFFTVWMRGRDGRWLYIAE